MLEQHEANVTVIRYLDNPPSLSALKKIAKALTMRPREFMRKGEAIYKELNLGRDDISDAELFNAMSKHPILMERPIAVTGNRAVVGRPPEVILQILDTSASPKR